MLSGGEGILPAASGYKGTVQKERIIDMEF
jgi:hypothetical protein